LGQGYIRTVAPKSEDADTAVLALFRIGDGCRGVCQRGCIGEAACEHWQQHTDQEYSSVHDGPPYDKSARINADILNYGFALMFIILEIVDDLESVLEQFRLNVNNFADHDK
jgi:hypothetical protein